MGPDSEEVRPQKGVRFCWREYKNFDGLPEIKWSPERKKEAGGKIADHRPGGREAHANNGYGADQDRPDATKSDTPNVENGKCSKDPETGNDDATDCKIGLIGQVQATLEI